MKEDGGRHRPPTTTEEHYDALFRANVKGPLFTVQKGLPLLSDGASIIQRASIGPEYRKQHRTDSIWKGIRR